MTNELGIFCDICGKPIDIGNEAEIRHNGRSICASCYAEMQAEREEERRRIKNGIAEEDIWGNFTASC